MIPFNFFEEIFSFEGARPENGLKIFSKHSFRNELSQDHTFFGTVIALRFFSKLVGRILYMHI